MIFALFDFLLAQTRYVPALLSTPMKLNPNQFLQRCPHCHVFIPAESAPICERAPDDTTVEIIPSPFGLYFHLNTLPASAIDDSKSVTIPVTDGQPRRQFPCSPTQPHIPRFEGVVDVNVNLSRIGCMKEEKSCYLFLQKILNPILINRNRLLLDVSCQKLYFLSIGSQRMVDMVLVDLTEMLPDLRKSLLQNHSGELYEHGKSLRAVLPHILCHVEICLENPAGHLKRIQDHYVNQQFATQPYRQRAYTILIHKSRFWIDLIQRSFDGKKYEELYPPPPDTVGIISPPTGCSPSPPTDCSHFPPVFTSPMQPSPVQPSLVSPPISSAPLEGMSLLEPYQKEVFIRFLLAPHEQLGFKSPSYVPPSGKLIGSGSSADVYLVTQTPYDYALKIYRKKAACESLLERALLSALPPCDALPKLVSPLGSLDPVEPPASAIPTSSSSSDPLPPLPPSTPSTPPTPPLLRPPPFLFFAGAGSTAYAGHLKKSNIVGLINALELLHSKGVCHGDVAPDNIIALDNRLILIDFGAAVPCGTAIYYRGRRRYAATRLWEDNPQETWREGVKLRPSDDLESLIKSLAVIRGVQLQGGSLMFGDIKYKLLTETEEKAKAIVINQSSGTITIPPDGMIYPLATLLAVARVGNHEALKQVVDIVLRSDGSTFPTCH